MFLQKKGFTLIELLVVFAIIGVLASIIVVSTANLRSKARDGKRVFDTQQITTALEAYYARNGFYPTFITTGAPLTAGGTTYMSEVPKNPEPRTDGNCPDADFRYDVNPGNNSYNLTFCIGNDSGSLKQGINVCGNGTCLPGSSVKATDNEGNKYRTVSIGGQLWMAENLRTKVKPDGTCINGGSAPCADASDDDAAIPRTCLNNNEASCQTYGAMYTLDAAMNGSTASGAQGICPNGWHVPTDAEYYTLEQSLTDSGANDCTLTEGWRCTGAGTKLAAGGSSGFNMQLGGVRTVAANFDDGVAGHVWTSTFSAVDEAWTRVVNPTDSNKVNREAGPNGDWSIGLRCIKNY